MAAGCVGLSGYTAYQGYQNRDRSMMLDSGITAAIGATCLIGAYHGPNWILAAGAMALAREGYNWLKTD